MTFQPLAALQLIVPTWLIVRLLSPSGWRHFTATVQFTRDGIGDVAELLLLLLEVLGRRGGGVLFEPLGGFFDGVKELRETLVKKLREDQVEIGKTYGFLVILVDLATESFFIIGLVLQAKCVVLKTIPGLNLLGGGLVFLGEFLSLIDHTINFFLRESALVVSNGNTLLFASALVAGCNLENSVCVELEGNFDLRNTTRSCWNAGKIELAE